MITFLTGRGRLARSSGRSLGDQKMFTLLWQAEDVLEVTSMILKTREVKRILTPHLLDRCLK